MGFGICGSVILLTLLYVCQCVVSETAVVGSLYQYTLNKEDFFDKYSPDSSHPVVFKPSLVTKPGLPSWLQYLQGDPGYLYGTPKLDSVGDLQIEIIGLSTFTYESSRIRVDLTVTENQAALRYLASFFIPDKSLDDLLSLDSQEAFLSAVSRVWPNVDLQIHQLQSGDELGLPNTLPTDTNQEEGVAVIVGSSSPFSSALRESEGRCTKAPQGIVLDGYTTTWCHITMSEVSPATTSDVDGGTPIYLGGAYNPPAMPMEEPSRMLEFIFIVAVPFGVIMLVILILAYIMYGRREGIKTRDSRSGSLQLTHHIEIRHASRDLRELSKRRDPATPRMSGAAGRRGIPSGPVDSAASSASGTPARHRHPQFGENSGSASSTPSMHPKMIPPPAYRLPPHPGGLQETSFSQDSPGSRRQTPGHTPGHTPRQTPVRPARGRSPKLSSPQRN